jgi:hypothetical protein
MINRNFFLFCSCIYVIRFPEMRDRSLVGDVAEAVWGLEFGVLSAVFVFSGFGPLAGRGSRCQHHFHGADGADALPLQGIGQQWPSGRGNDELRTPGGFGVRGLGFGVLNSVFCLLNSVFCQLWWRPMDWIATGR